MRKILVLTFIALLFVACNFAKNAAKFRPDIKVTWINPLGTYVNVGDTLADITEVDFIPQNSVDAYLKGFIFTYYDGNGNVIFGPSELFPLFAKVDGVVDPDSVNTTKILNLKIPSDTVAIYLYNTKLQSAKAKLDFVFTDQYEMGSIDTASTWFGFYRFP